MRSFESREDYLETILVLYQEKGAVRSIDVAERMKFSKPSVSRAVGLLKSAGLVTMDREGFLRLTSEGEAAARGVYERHTVLRDFLIQIGVDAAAAAEDACRMEHVISKQTFESIRKQLKDEDKERIVR